MLEFVQILTAVLVAIALAPSLAHALELPGKMRLNRDAYMAVQPIYYPGFTIAGGIGEAGGLIAAIVLLLLTPRGTTTFWLAAIGLAGLLGMQLVYWTRTHPTNKFWLQHQKLGTAGASFFEFEPAGEKRVAELDWKAMRDRWEHSHVIRAGLAFLSFLAVVLAISVS